MFACSRARVVGLVRRLALVLTRGQPPVHAREVDRAVLTAMAVAQRRSDHEDRVRDVLSQPRRMLSRQNRLVRVVEDGRRRDYGLGLEAPIPELRQFVIDRAPGPLADRLGKLVGLRVARGSTRAPTSARIVVAAASSPSRQRAM